MQVNHKRVARIMREDSLLGIQPKRFVVTTNSSHKFEVANKTLTKNPTEPDSSTAPPIDAATREQTAGKCPASCSLLSASSAPARPLRRRQPFSARPHERCAVTASSPRVIPSCGLSV
jgi:hypothetical protein